MALFRTSLFSQRLLAKRIPQAALNRAVYALFKLTPEEIALFESGTDT